jgi:hypothetical protein
MESIRSLISAVAAAAAVLSPVLAQAEPVSVTAAVCGPTACVPIPPPLVAAVIAAPVVIRNVEAAGNESGALAQALRGVVGVSVRDIEKHGIWGGPNSIFRCPFGGC